MSSCKGIESKNYKLPKKCPRPQCITVANNLTELEDKFGCRNMEDGKLIPQSWCRECRKEGIKS